ncbi:hypothetical protein TRVA0_007S03686 [Trichomonascus vanleenenianus]|uniref:uncharacterized protein n=1 Tax=Trichomonascus vanleenenianus TaxID=2268995 RepID=UPI003ECA294F
MAIGTRATIARNLRRKRAKQVERAKKLLKQVLKLREKQKRRKEKQLKADPIEKFLNRNVIECDNPFNLVVPLPPFPYEPLTWQDRDVPYNYITPVAHTKVDPIDAPSKIASGDVVNIQYLHLDRSTSMPSAETQLAQIRDVDWDNQSLEIQLAFEFMGCDADGTYVTEVNGERVRKLDYGFRTVPIPEIISLEKIGEASLQQLNHFIPYFEEKS